MCVVLGDLLIINLFCIFHLTNSNKKMGEPCTFDDLIQFNFLLKEEFAT